MGRRSLAEIETRQRVERTIRQRTRRDIGRGLHTITADEARELTGGELPAPGYETMVEIEGDRFWLAHARDRGRNVWAIRHCPAWRWDGDLLATRPAVIVESDKEP